MDFEKFFLFRKFEIVDNYKTTYANPNHGIFVAPFPKEISTIEVKYYELLSYDNHEIVKDEYGSNATDR